MTSSLLCSQFFSDLIDYWRIFCKVDYLFIRRFFYMTKFFNFFFLSFKDF